jgi:hypothetical protein
MASHDVPSITEALELAKQHPHWRTLQLTAQWVQTGQRVVTDVARIHFNGRIPQALQSLGIPPALLLYEVDAGDFSALPSHTDS